MINKTKIFIVVSFVAIFGLKDVLSQDNNAFLEMISRSDNFQLVEIEKNIFEKDPTILNIDTAGRIVSSTEDQITFYDENFKKLWSKSIEEQYSYDVRANVSSDIIIVSELRGERYSGKFVLDRNGNEIMIPREYMRVSEDGKYIYDSNEYLNYKITQDKIFNSDGEIIEIDLVKVLNLNLDPKIRNGLQLRVLRNDIAVAIIVERDTREGEFGYKNKLERADLVAFSLDDKEIKFRYSLLNSESNYNSTNRLSKINIKPGRLYVNNNHLYFHELKNQNDDKLIVVNLKSGSVIHESVENNLLSYRPSKDGLSVLKLEVVDSKRELVLKKLNIDSETSYGIIDQVYQISDFRIDSSFVQIIQKTTDPSLKDKLLFLDTDNNEPINIEGFFGSVNNGIISMNNSAYRFNGK